MGLTVHYDITSHTKSTDRAKQLVEKMRQLALDLPFESVDDEVRYLSPEVCQKDLESYRGNDELFHVLLDCGTHGVELPWSPKDRRMSVSCQPIEAFHFYTCPGPGSEWAGFGLTRFPAEIEVTWRPEDDARFTKTIKQGGCTHWEFDQYKWERYCVRKKIEVRERYGRGKYSLAYHKDKKFEEQRKVKTKLGSGWHFGSFCKTQYASDPTCGGIPNFLRCHISLITLLDRIAKLPGTKVEFDDEGKYGRSHYTDDPYAEERVYTWHDGKYNVKALVEEVGSWNEMIAAFGGALNDLVAGSGMEMAAPIKSFPNFEHLEFKGSQSEHLQPFLKMMAKLADEKKESVA